MGSLNKQQQEQQMALEQAKLDQQSRFKEMDMQQQQEQASRPVANGAGIFNDSDIATVAEQIQGL